MIDIKIIEFDDYYLGYKLKAIYQDGVLIATNGPTILESTRLFDYLYKILNADKPITVSTEERGRKIWGWNFVPREYQIFDSSLEKAHIRNQGYNDPNYKGLLPSHKKTILCIITKKDKL